MQVNGTVWKYTTSFLAGVVLTMIGAYFSNQKDLVTRREFTEMEVRYDQRMEKQDAQQIEITQSLTLISIELGKLTEDLKLNSRPQR